MNGYKKLEQELNFMYDIIVEVAFLKSEDVKEENIPDNMKSIYKSIININKVFDLKYISQNKENFEENLLYYTGLTKEDVIKNIMFELYANEIHKDAKLNTKDYLTESQFLKEYTDFQVRKECIDLKNEDDIKMKIDERIKDRKRYNSKYYLAKYFFNSKISLSEGNAAFWQNVTHYSKLFGNIDDVNINCPKSDKCKDSKFPNFQVPFYSSLACNYSSSQNVLTYFLNEDFDKVNFKGQRVSSSYIDFIKELINICDKKEKYKNISYYMIEKEFNPVTIEKLVGILLKYSENKVSQKKMYTVIDRLYFLSTINPMIFSNNKFFEIIADSHLKNEDESRGFPVGFEIVNLRFINKFYKILSSIANETFKNKMKDLVNADEESFLSIYQEKGQSILSSMENLEGYINKFSIKDSLEFIMKLKKQTNICISDVNRKIKEHNKIKNGRNISELNQDEVLQCVYIVEDIDELVHYDDMLRLLFNITKAI